jgi:orotate phosphoribosyltransferase
VSVLDALPAREGHFLLESGYHTNVWLTLDAVFVDPVRVAPMIAVLADRLERHEISAVCGPLLGGAFLAQQLATALDIEFYYAVPDGLPVQAGLFQAHYRLPSELRRRIRGQRVAIVDEAISAGSSVRATMTAVTDAGASTVAIGTLLMLGQTALDHFGALKIPVEALERRGLPTWAPDECPICREGVALEDPRGEAGSEAE